jgi:hypothetical protein
VPNVGVFEIPAEDAGSWVSVLIATLPRSIILGLPWAAERRVGAQTGADLVWRGAQFKTPEMVIEIKFL